jgi:protoporphyrinogen oxidase
MTRALIQRLETGQIHTHSTVEAIDPRSRTARIGGETVHWNAVVSTIPLPELCRVLVAPPEDVLQAASLLRSTAVRYLNVATRSTPRVDYHWIYVPERRYPFYRVGIYTNAVPSMAPPGQGALYVELADRGAEPDVDRLVREIAPALTAAGALNSIDDILFAELKELKYAYVVFDERYQSAVATITGYLETQSIFPRGRYGSWVYNGMEDCILAGREIALKLSA